MNNLKSRLSDALYERGMSQATLAAILDVPRSSISNWLKNESIPTSHLIKLALELNISIDWLISGEGPQKLFGPQYISLSEQSLVESLRTLGDEFTATYLSLLCQTTGSAYGNVPYQSIGLLRFMNDTRMAWGVIGNDGRLINASPGLFDLLGVERDKPSDLIGTNAFLWIAEEYISAAVVRFSRFLDGNESRPDSRPFRCRALTKNRELSPPLTIYSSYELCEEDPKQNKIHLVIV